MASIHKCQEREVTALPGDTSCWSLTQTLRAQHREHWLRFLSPCVEPVWSLGDSLLSLHRLQRRGLNCYMYAPKDELKHRLLWREPYTEHEAGRASAGPLGGLQAPRVSEGLGHSYFHPVRTPPIAWRPPDLAKGKETPRQCPSCGIA